jgi:alpha-L-rhamnosidase
MKPSAFRSQTAPFLSWGSFLVLLAAAVPGIAEPAFKSAQAIWPAGREKEKNLFVGFRAGFPRPAAGPVVLRAGGSTLYRVFLNGEFLAHGPARGPHGFYRMDELDLTARLQPGTNVVAFEVAGYNVNSYYLLDQPSFLQAEVVADGQVLAATGGAGAPFEAAILKERVQKVQRYSFQRPFTEVYRLAPGGSRWRASLEAPLETTRWAVQPALAWLPRRVPYPDYVRRPPLRLVADGELKTGVKVDHPWKDRSLTDIGPKLGGYPEVELATLPSLELQTVATTNLRPVPAGGPASQAVSLQEKTCRIVDLGCNLTGFPGAKIHCQRPARVFFTFDEILTQGDVDFKRLGCVNAVGWELPPGDYEVETFEPYTLRYWKVMVLEGECTVEDLYLRELANPAVDQAQFAASDERFNRLFEAGRETFRQNALDIFMDCPSRERAGWLCDSFFTARVARDLSGNCLLEKNFFENFLLPARFAHLPEGMLPMCYPADHNDGVFIPNWSLWFVVELEEYLARSGDRALVDALRPRVLRLLEYFRGFQNQDGLLEKLASWVFVEWSKANDFVQDVNYPSNMLYARALQAAGRMYGLADLAGQAEKIRGVIRQQSFDGEFFVDNAVRKNGRLEVTRNRSEVCQYFAFFFGLATPESHPQLWQTLVRDFGPGRKQTKAFPEVHPANAFVGNVLRLELLSRHGRCQQLLDESLAYQLYMVEQTGTLWENDGAYASCDHGFASHGGVRVLYRDVLGLYEVDTVQKRVRLRFANLRLDWCEGRLPTPDGPVALRWRKQGGRLVYQAAFPAGYQVTVENQSQLELVAQ